MAPLLHAGGEPIIELLMDLVELRHFEEDGLDLLARQHRLRGGGCSLQRLHGLEEGTGEAAKVTHEGGTDERAHHFSGVWYDHRKSRLCAI